ncbi:MAG: isoamylase early set domain-containing protein [Candidatus Omnitrophica bacterium]|nr:isoamylase early set domain-containing protein [Candidatus Omnitrophota bacterium]
MSPNIFKKKNLEKVIQFEYYAPLARKVHLAGTFNQWKPAGTILKKDASGHWRLSLKLPPGRYEYRYLVDGEWHNDQRPMECIPNAFGSWNCVIEIH